MNNQSPPLAERKTLHVRRQLDPATQGTLHARGPKNIPTILASLILGCTLILVLNACEPIGGSPPVTTVTSRVASNTPAVLTTQPGESESPTRIVTATSPASPELTSLPTLRTTGAPIAQGAASTPEPLAGTPLPATIHSFDITPPQITAGDPITLSWSAVGDRTLINKLDYKGRLLEPAYTVPLSGTLVITDYHRQGNRTGFMLSACSGGLCDNATISAEVICAHEWFFSFPPPECPVAPSHMAVVAQHFERGLMLWLEATDWRVHDEILILYDDDPAERPRWEMTVDEWDPGMPEEDPGVVPPSGYLEPVRGFGMVWREAPGVRERLGWATDNEFVVENGAFQCALASYGRCYVTGPGDVVYLLEPESSGWGTEPEPPDGIPPTPVAPPAEVPQPTSQPADAPEILSFSADPDPADPSGSVTLSWQAAGASSGTVHWLDKEMEPVIHSDLPLSGSLSVDLSQVKFVDGDTVQFSLTIHDAGRHLIFDSRGDPISILIRVPLLTDMRIESFSASPDLVERGGTVTLTWNVPNSESVAITRLSPEGIFQPTEAPYLPASGSIELPVPEDYGESITYLLGARDANGVGLDRTITVGVICPYDDYIAVICPLTRDTTSAAYQPFEGGQMVWRGDTREIYVLFNDGGYATFEDTWSEGEPVGIDETPPQGLLAPERGFGELWWNQPAVRERLGWATAGEVGYTAVIETAHISPGRYPSTDTFLTLPDYRVVQLSGRFLTWSVTQ
jgi:hypothetical protein